MHDPDMPLEVFDDRSDPPSLVLFAWVLCAVQILVVCGLGVVAWAAERGAREVQDSARCHCREYWEFPTRMERRSGDGAACAGEACMPLASAAQPVEAAAAQRGRYGVTRNFGNLEAFLAAPDPGMAATFGVLLMEAAADEEGLWVGALRYIIINPARPRQQAAVTVSTRSAAGRFLRQRGAGHRYAGIRTVWPATVTLAWSRQAVPELQLEQVLAWGFPQSPEGPEGAVGSVTLAIRRHLMMAADQKAITQD
jgi:hypothetical protein